MRTGGGLCPRVLLPEEPLGAAGAVTAEGGGAEGGAPRGPQQGGCFAGLQAPRLPPALLRGRALGPRAARIPCAPPAARSHLAVTSLALRVAGESQSQGWDGPES